MKKLYITGIEIAYYFICKRKLWLFSKDITMEQNNQLVELGKIIHEITYKNKRKEIEFEGIKIDFFEKKNALIHEVKKGKTMEKAHVWQMKYYLYRLKLLGINCKGMIDYPLLRQRVTVILEKGDIEKLEDLINKIEEIKSLKIPPKVIDKIFCKKCSYYELCYA
ncbi:CRISPR-associated protein Cas4 [Nitratiruptor tergarcus]|uniref:CRISPR-associated exonuclease Cas4 n=1 Tax=Nitratiruptor tergarcus DSM 16512 TaxID=1069081 RepID=A0A1W1WRP0_9BACT|nr:CRISPR-associated protein Cas4 [Nitratiruptor tergarcus]SMC08872.1 CRISPR-associated exonuclease Cas4 [Nitratiruptor tergarcus DSM 16512]